MSKFGVTSLLTVGSVLMLFILASTGAPLQSGLRYDRDPAALKSKQKQVCQDPILIEVLDQLKRRDRLARGIRANQVEYVNEIEKLYHRTHQFRRASEAVFYVSTSIISATTIFKLGEALSGRIWGGQSLLLLLRTINERLVNGERRRLEFNLAADPLGPAMLYAIEDVKLRITERFSLFEQQQRRLTEASNEIMKQFSSNFWGHVSDGLTLGADGDDYTAALYAEAKFRLALYESELEYTTRATVAIRNMCLGALRNSRPLDSNDLIQLVPIL